MHGVHTHFVCSILWIVGQISWNVNEIGYVNYKKRRLCKYFFLLLLFLRTEINSCFLLSLWDFLLLFLFFHLLYLFIFVNTEMLIIEEPSSLQQSAHSETERKIRNDSFVMTSQSNRNETDNNFGEILVSSFHKFYRPKCIYFFHFMLGFHLKEIKNLLIYVWKACYRDSQYSIN